MFGMNGFHVSASGAIQGHRGPLVLDTTENILGNGESVQHFLPFPLWVPRGSVVKCLTRNPGVLGSSRTRSSGFFRGSVLG